MAFIYLITLSHLYLLIAAVKAPMRH